MSVAQVERYRNEAARCWKLAGEATQVKVAQTWADRARAFEQAAKDLQQAPRVAK